MAIKDIIGPGIGPAASIGFLITRGLDWEPEVYGAQSRRRYEREPEPQDDELGILLALIELDV